jgi:hypothetical protein
MQPASTNDSAAAANPEVSPSEAICNRASEVMLKLLDGIERNIADGVMPSPHLEAYEALCRAESARRG